MTDNALFIEVIQRDKDICSNCFRRTHSRYERNYRLVPVQVGFSEWDVEPMEVGEVEMTIEVEGTEERDKKESLGGLPDDVYPVGEAITDVPADEPSGGVVTICKCGFRWAPEWEVEEWKNRPLPKKLFFEYAQNLKERLNEAGVDYDERALDEYLDDKKSDPDEQFADDRLFARGIRHASSVETVRR